MLRLSPIPYGHFRCPECNKPDITPGNIIFQGIHLVADLECDACGFEFYHDFPIGQAITTPVIIDKKELRLISPGGIEWFSQPLLQGFINPASGDVSVEIIQRSKINKDEPVIFFNCLDAWYGHILLKLFNVQFYHEKNPGYRKIVLIPAGFNWMIPDYVDEIWATDIKLRNTLNHYPQLDAFIKSELFKYNTVFYSSGYSHPPLEKIKAADFFKTLPFMPESFFRHKPIVTLIYREDRIWVGPLLNKLFHFFTRKKFSLCKKILLQYQVRKFNRLAARLQKNIPGLMIYVCGTGKEGRLASIVEDKRATVITEQQEREWCDIYSRSHVVFGIHGSNMLIPSALAGAWVEILPADRLANITQDLFCRYTHSTMNYLGRFASEHDPVSRVAALVSTIFNSYASFSKQQQILDFGEVK